MSSSSGVLPHVPHAVADTAPPTPCTHCKWSGSSRRKQDITCSIGDTHRLVVKGLSLGCPRMPTLWHRAKYPFHWQSFFHALSHFQRPMYTCNGPVGLRASESRPSDSESCSFAHRSCSHHPPSQQGLIPGNSTSLCVPLAAFKGFIMVH